MKIVNIHLVFDQKNSYLSIDIRFAENIFYSCFSYWNITNIHNSFFVTNIADNVYFCSTVWNNNYNIFYSRYITNCNNIWFSSNLIWCSECINCDDLQNKKYCIENKEYSKEEYLKKKKEILKDKKEFLNYYKKINKKALNYNSKNVSWNALYFSENAHNSYFLKRIKNANNTMVWDWFDFCENVYDSFDIWINSKDLYWCFWVWLNSTNIYLSWGSWENSSNIFYSYALGSCSHCIWCIWLKNKSYCILNKQYSKQEWEELSDKIFSQMEKDWILWDFFPWELNPFYFNDTMAWLLWDFTKEEVEKEGYMWRDKEIKVDIPEWSEVISTKDLNNYQWYNENWEWKINPEILEKIIKDDKWNYYRIIKMEYDFLIKHWLPLPELHWMDRMKLNLGMS